MNFENFYKKNESFYDEIMRRWWIFSVLVAAVFIGFVFMPDRDEPKSPARPALRTERQQRVDAVCSGLPTPEDFHLVEKTAPTETSDSTWVAYTFQSSRAAEEVYPTFILWFSDHGWTDDKRTDERLEFSKDNRTIWIAPFSVEPNDYFRINCTEWKAVVPVD